MNVDVTAVTLLLFSTSSFDILEFIPILSYFYTGFFVRADFEFFLGLPSGGEARPGSFLFVDILDFDWPVFGGFFSALFMLLFIGTLSIVSIGVFDVS